MRTGNRGLRWGLAAAAALVLLSVGAAALAGPARADTVTYEPTIASDQADYAPGSLVTITGAAWPAGDLLQVVTNDSAGSTWSDIGYPMTDANGDFVYAVQLPSWFVSTYTVVASDPDGLSASTSFTDSSLNIDNSSKPDNPTNSQSAHFTFGENGASQSPQCSLDNTAFGGCASFTVGGPGGSGTQDYSSLSEGTHTFRVKTTTLSDSYTWFVDLTPPETSISSNPPSSTTTTSASFGYSGTDNHSASNKLKFSCSLDGAAFSTCGAGGVTYNGLALGGHTFDVRATDEAGNTDPTAAHYAWTITSPLAAPTVTKDAVGSPEYASGSNTYVTSSSLLGFTVTGSSLGACTVSVDGPGSNDASFNCAAGDNTYTLGGKLSSPPDGAYANSGSATNATATASDSFSVILDNTPPTTSDNADSSWHNTAQTVTLTPSDGSGSGVASTSYKLDGAATYTGGTSVLVSGDGTHTLAYHSTDNLGNTESPDKTATVKIDTVKPLLSVSHTADGSNGWNVTSPVVVSVAASDGGSGLGGDPVCHLDGGSTAMSLAAGSSGSWTAEVTGQGGHTVACSVSDLAGNSESASDSTIKLDSVAPSIVVSHTADGENGWNTSSPVSVSIAVGDAGSGLAGAPTCLDGADPLAVSGSASPYSASVSGEGTHSISCSVSDLAGNSNSDDDTVKIDTVAPSVSGSPTTSPNGAGWYNADVTIHWTCSDAASGVVSSGPGACPVDSVISSEGTGLTLNSGTVSDNAGNTTSADSSPGVNLDETGPGITWNGGPADGGSYYYGFLPAAPTCTATDSLSGPKDCSVSGYGTGVGAYTLTATAHDNADNETQATHRYTVLAWTLNGFFQPTDMSGVWNTVKNGATVPLKFEIFAGPTELTSTSFVAGLTAKGVACPTTGYLADDIEVTATGGTSLRYDATAGQFVYNWQTPKKAGSCYTVTMTTQDGSSLSANFMLK